MCGLLCHCLISSCDLESVPSHLKSVNLKLGYWVSLYSIVCASTCKHVCKHEMSDAQGMM